MNRREFLTWVGIGGLASYLPVVLAACSSNQPESNTEASTQTNTGSPARTDGFQSVGTVAQLESNNGQLLDKAFSAGAVLVIRAPSDPNKLSAINPTCTHRNCSVSWDSNEKVLLCPCHGSKFSPDGQVLNGPATEPLPPYEVKVENDSILIKTS